MNFSKLSEKFRRIGEYRKFYHLMGPTFCWKKITKNNAVLECQFHGRSFKIRPCDSDIEVLLKIFIDREYDLESLRCWDQLKSIYQGRINGGVYPLIIDLGANIGASAIFFSEMFPQSDIIAIEPDTDNFALLSHNVRDMGRIAPIQAAIGSEPGFVTLTPGKASWGVTTVRSEAGFPVVTIDDIRQMRPGANVFIVKIDIEGFEKDLFSTNTAWLDDVDILIIEPHDWLLQGQRTSRNFQREMGARDFDLLIQGENLIYVRAR